MKNKLPENMTADERKELKIEFAPGAFDGFDGTQEELDELMAEIKKMVLDGSLFDKSRSVDIEDLLESDDPEDQEIAEKLLRAVNNEPDKRKLQ